VWARARARTILIVCVFLDIRCVTCAQSKIRPELPHEIVTRVQVSRSFCPHLAACCRPEAAGAGDGAAAAIRGVVVEGAEVVAVQEPHTQTTFTREWVEMRVYGEENRRNRTSLKCIRARGE
jgi:hypothetical protein